GIRAGHVTGVQTCALPIPPNCGRTSQGSGTRSDAKRKRLAKRSIKVLKFSKQLSKPCRRWAKRTLMSKPQRERNISLSSSPQDRSEERRVGKVATSEEVTW